MKILLDACLSPQAKIQLEAAGHDVVWAGEWREDAGDSVILSQACQQERVLVTLDKDFGELGVLREARHCGILRLVNFRAAQQGQVCVQVLASHADDLRRGAILTAEPGRLRIRRGARPGG